MPVALRSLLDELTPRTLEATFVEPEVPFDEVQGALYSAERCPDTCARCQQHTDVCTATGRTN